MDFLRFVAGEIGLAGAVETAFTVDSGVDLVIRKNEPILLWIVGQVFHFIELEEFPGFLHFGFAAGEAGGLEGLEGGEVPLQVAIVVRITIFWTKLHIILDKTAFMALDPQDTRRPLHP